MWRSIVVLGLATALAAPAAAQVDVRGRQKTRVPDSLVEATRTSSITTRSEGWLGIGLSCSQCSLSVMGNGDMRRWTFSEPPSVFSVDDNGPGDKAGLRIGDVLTAVDGVALVTREGGTRFGSIRPGQTVRLTYRREGRERTVEMVAGRRAADREDVMAAAQAMRRAQELQQRTLEMSRRQLERSQDELARLRNEMESRLEEAQSQPDTASLEQLQRMRRVLQEQQRLLARELAERSTLEGRDWAELAPTLAPPAMPAEPAQPAMPAQPAEPPEPALAPEAPSPYRWHRSFGPLRYTGRLGDVVIEARGPGGVTTTESDSEVVVTAGDLSVRLALRPVAPRAAPAQTPAARPPRD